MNYAALQSRLMVILVRIAIVGLGTSIVASTGQVIYTLHLAHGWPFAILLGMATVSMNAVLVALTIMNRRSNANRLVSVVLVTTLFALLTVELGGNLYAAAEQLAEHQSRSPAAWALSPLLGGFWLSGIYPLINTASVWLLGEILVQRIIDEEAQSPGANAAAVNGRTEYDSTQGARFWAPKS